MNLELLTPFELDPVSILRPWVQTGAPDYLNFAFQFDSLNKGTEIDATIGTRLVLID